MCKNSKFSKLSSNQKQHKQAGFTLVEVVVVIAVLFVLMAVAIPRIMQGVSQGDIGVIRTHVVEIQQGATAYRQINGSYSGLSMGILDDNQFVTDELGDGVGKNPYGGDYNASASSNPTEYIVTISGITNDKVGNQLALGYGRYGVATYSSGTLSITFKG